VDRLQPSVNFKPIHFLMVMWLGWGIKSFKDVGVSGMSCSTISRYPPTQVNFESHVYKFDFCGWESFFILLDIIFFGEVFGFVSQF